MTEYEKWFYSARHPETNLPYATVLLYQVCGSDQQRFDIGEPLLQAAFEAGMASRELEASDNG